jgi:hypothetical protein
MNAIWKNDLNINYFNAYAWGNRTLSDKKKSFCFQIEFCYYLCTVNPLKARISRQHIKPNFFNSKSVSLIYKTKYSFNMASKPFIDSGYTMQSVCEQKLTNEE